jgi:septal ring factor EnvC (AmiA/AmiB activator)
MMSRIENITLQLKKMESSSEAQDSSSAPLFQELIDKITEKTESLRLEIIANNAKYEKAQEDLAAVREEWNAVRVRKLESEKRLQTLDKNVNVYSHFFNQKIYDLIHPPPSRPPIII